MAAFVAPLMPMARGALAAREPINIDTFDDRPSPKTTTYRYDHEGRLLAVVEPVEGESTTFVDPPEAPITFQYDEV